MRGPSRVCLAYGSPCAGQPPAPCRHRPNLVRPHGETLSGFGSQTSAGHREENQVQRGDQDGRPGRNAAKSGHGGRWLRPHRPPAPRRRSRPNAMGQAAHLTEQDDGRHGQQDRCGAQRSDLGAEPVWAARGPRWRGPLSGPESRWPDERQRRATHRRSAPRPPATVTARPTRSRQPEASRKAIAYGIQDRTGRLFRPEVVEPSARHDSQSSRGAAPPRRRRQRQCQDECDHGCGTYDRAPPPRRQQVCRTAARPDPAPASR